MNKGDLVNDGGKGCGHQKAAADAVEAVLKGITKALKKKQAVTIVGFGTFKVGKRKARIGRNPRPAQRSKSRRRMSRSLWPAKS